MLQPTSDTDGATKKYVDDSSVNVSNYLKGDGKAQMTGDLNTDNCKIVNLNDEPTTGTDGVNKNYVDSVVATSHVKPSHFKAKFAFLMSNVLEWTDEIDGGNSFTMTKIADLSPSKGNVHTYNHKVIYTTIIKNSQGGYKYKMSANFFTLALDVDYTLCIEILNTDYQLWHKAKISVDKVISQGLTIGIVSVRKFSHRYTDSKNQTEYMYYHRMIINFRKTAPAHPYFLHLLVDISQAGTDLGVYPKNWTNNYVTAYGILVQVSDVDDDNVYDYHTAFDIKPTEVSFNFDINAKQKAIRNIKLEQNINNSAATVAMVKELTPFTKHALYRDISNKFITSVMQANIICH